MDPKKEKWYFQIRCPTVRAVKGKPSPLACFTQFVEDFKEILLLFRQLTSSWVKGES